MLLLTEYAEALERSKRPPDAAAAKYIRANMGLLIRLWKKFANGLNTADREELMQVTVLACVAATRAPDAETALKSIHNEMQNLKRHAASWRDRKVASIDTNGEEI